MSSTCEILSLGQTDFADDLIAADNCGESGADVDATLPYADHDATLPYIDDAAIRSNSQQRSRNAR